MKFKEDRLEKIFRLSLAQKNALERLGLKTARDLLFYFPTRYGTPSAIRNIEHLEADQETVVFGRIKNLSVKKTFRSHLAISTAKLEDQTGTIELVWFREPYIAKMFAENSLVRIEGKVSTKKSPGSENPKLYFANPKIEKVVRLPEGSSDSLFARDEQHSLQPVYPETRGISSNWIFYAVQKLIKLGFQSALPDPIPNEILEKYHLPKLQTALIWVHLPQKESDAEVARKRFAFEEILNVQLDRARERYLSHKTRSFSIKKSAKEIESFAQTFPFPLTQAQKRVTQSILEDMARGYPMSRLIEGDVGSGKTAVAAIASFATVTTLPPERQFGNLQVAYMAPTEILAEQHFESFIEYFAKYKVNVGLITGSGAKKFPSKISNDKWTKISKAQLLRWVENGEIPILIGTHALIQKSVKFKNLGLIVIDEQHRFGIKQRMALRRKHDIVPHLLSMTATPIPRTLALTIFGDLDLSLLDELPPGRKPVQTKIVLPQDRDEAYEFVRQELNRGRQAYVICPRIDEPDLQKELSLNARSVREEAERLGKKVFKEFKIGTLTGKDSPKEKTEKMRAFKEGRIDILVATSVVEVGVNVPNATVILIENAERFGLAQLHQLRGRVIRSSHQAYCFVFTESNSVKTASRLKSFVKAKNGFELAEADLQQRGTGGLGQNARQWGVSDLAMEALRNIKMVEAARAEATRLITEDFDLKNYPLLASKLSQNQIHLE